MQPSISNLAISGLPANVLGPNFFSKLRRDGLVDGGAEFYFISSLKCLFPNIHSVVRVMGFSVKVSASCLCKPPKVECVKTFSTLPAAFFNVGTTYRPTQQKRFSIHQQE